MAEVVGLVSGAITLAGLFKLCIEAFDVIQAGRNQEMDTKKLVLRLNIEKCRLYTWGQAMGLTEASGEDQRPIDILPFPNLVRDTLEIIFRIFHNSHDIQDRYGCETVSEQTSAQALVPGYSSFPAADRLASSFRNFHVRTLSNDTTRLIGRVRWAIYDHKKFLSLISEVRDLINGLQQITEPLIAARRQESAMKNAILTITDVEILNVVADVCKHDHQRISDAASLRAETLSTPSAQNNEITAWIQTVEQPDEDDITIAEIEGLVLAELKHVLAQMMTSEGNKEFLESILRAQKDLKIKDMGSEHAALVTKMQTEMEEIARTAKRDQTSMRVIALVTLIFLPASFISTMFSMSIYTATP
jgi:Prion-inhibition and propagation